MNMQLKIAVIIPSYKVREHILAVIESIGPEIKEFMWLKIAALTSPPAMSKPIAKIHASLSFGMPKTKVLEVPL